MISAPWAAGHAESDAGQWWQGGVVHVDLSARTDLTTALLSNPLQWRVRVVERVEVDTATSCKRSRSLQSAPLRGLLTTDIPDEAETALLVLNVASVPRGALLDLDVSGPDECPAFLLPREEIAARQADYVRELAKSAALDVDEDLQLLLQSLLGFTDAGWGFKTAAQLDAHAAEYLEDGFQLQIPASVSDELRRMDMTAATLLEPFASAVPATLDTPGLALSPTQHPLLGLPAWAALRGVHQTEPQEIPSVLQGYLNLLEMASALADAAADLERQRAAEDLLDSLADYGRNYDLMVVTKVPLDEPFIVKYSERRTLELDGQSHTHQELVISDAVSNHVVLTVADPNVVITKVQALGTGRSEDAYGAFATRRSPQTYAVYAHGEDRDYRATLAFALAPLRRLQFVTTVTTVLLVLLAAAVVREGPDQLRDLALIIGSSALAASVLATREASTLTSHLRRRSTFWLAVALLLLLGAGAASYLGFL